MHRSRSFKGLLRLPLLDCWQEVPRAQRSRRVRTAGHLGWGRTPGTRPPEHSVHVAVTTRSEGSARGPGGRRAGPGVEHGSRSVSRVLSAARSPRGVTVISLRPRSPAASSSLPGDRRAASSPPTWPCSGRGLPGRTVASPPVGSYPTVAPWPPRMRDGGLFLWHSPWGRPRWALPSALPFGARTFLGANRAATVRPAPGTYGSIGAAPGKGAACDALRRRPRPAQPPRTCDRAQRHTLWVPCDRRAGAVLPATATVRRAAARPVVCA